MKKQLLSLIAIFIAGIISAQTGFNYKALITDNGSVLANQSVSIKFTILENGTTNVYQESLTATTDANGIVSANIGEGTPVSGNFNTINWGNRQSLKVEIDTGSGYQDFGTNPLKWVPTAKYADTAGNVFSGNFNDLSNVPAGLSDGDDDTHLTDAQIAAMGYIKNPNDADHSSTNEIQTLSVSGNQLSISSGNTVTLPTGTGGDQWGSQVVQSNSSLSGDGTSANPLAVNTSSSVFNNWDKNASDDFSGDYDDLSNKPDVFYVDDGSGNTATGYNQNIKHKGNIIIGTTFSSAGLGKSSLRINRRVNNEESYGVTAVVGGTGSNNHFGGFFMLTDAGSGIQYGVHIANINSGNGNHYGISTYLASNGTGTQIGSNNLIVNTGNGTHYGTYNKLTGTGTGRHHGIYNYLSGDGTGQQYGVKTIIDNTGNSYHYGNYVDLQGTGTGNKYGIYARILTTAGGTHYAIYGEAEKAGSYAGYFKGDVYASQKIGIGTDMPQTDLHIKGDGNKVIKVEATNTGGASILTLKTDASTYDYLQFKKFHTNYGGTIAGGLSLGGLSVIKTGATADDLLIDVINDKNMYFATHNQVNMTITNTGNVEVKNKITAPDSGDTDMKAYVYGSITSNGSTTLNGAYSNGFSVSKTAIGVYEISFTGANKPTHSYEYTVMANMRYGDIGFITVENNGDKFTISTYNTSGNPSSKAFNFVVYKK